MNSLNSMLDGINTILYTYTLIPLLIICGLYFTIRTKFVQFTLFKEALIVLKEKTSSKNDVSSFQALMISTASRVGTGNIAGVATAIAIGGSGSIVWMWLLAIIGGASAFIESTLAQIYKVKNGSEFVGGPSYYIERALGNKFLGIVFSIALICCFAYGFNPLQAYNAGSTLNYYISGYDATMFPKIVGLVFAILTALVIFGGVSRISSISSAIVPIMSVIYIGMSIVVTIFNFSSIPTVFSEVFKQAFDFKAIFGGFTGSCVMYGIKRGLYSNEAGMGSAPNAAATASVSHPVKQGLAQMISVFIDTLLICSATAFILLLSGVKGSSELKSMSFVQEAVKSQFGVLGVHFLTVSVFLFAFTSLIGNYYYTEANVKFITKNKTALLIFRATVVLMIYMGAQFSFDTAWNVADILMGIMALINISVILILGKIALNALKDYTDQKKKGIESPVFKAESIGVKNTDLWK